MSMSRFVQRRAFSAFPQALRNAPAAGATGVLSMTPFGAAAPAPRAPVAVRDRKFLPESRSALLPQTCAAPRADFPHVLDADGSGAAAAQWGALAREKFDECLAQHGAVMIRNLPLASPEEFGAFVKGLGWRTQSLNDYLKCMGARSMTSTVITEEVRTASDDPDEYTIEPHNEWHTAGFPRKIMLYCVEPPTDGGEWCLGDGRGILKGLRPEVVEKFERLSVKYTVFYESRANAFYNNWQDNVGESKEQVEAYLKGLKYDWSWGVNDSLTYWQNFPVTTEHPVTGEKVWFNQLHAHHETFYKGAHPQFVDQPAEFTGWPVRTCYGDGTPIEDDVLEHVREVVWANTVAVTPEKGSLLMCDNMLTLHGRMGFKEGTTRKIFVASVYE